jgi:hypothetical protein
MRAKKRLKKRVKKGIKSVKSTSPEAYVAGAGGLLGSAAVLVLTATKSGRELLVRTAQLTRRSEGDEPDAAESDSEEPDAQDEAPSEPAGDAEVKGKPEADTNGETSPRPHKSEAAHAANARSAVPPRPRSQG